ncbi:zinc-dependent alcohol dehydrogenase family protein [Altererythrobacter lutimaris]|uniref:Alcohol dehydrogenase catalytic domain-containing protein n=1 Tax=Altererythrobacter lutimaris TaxID=2743979 RepID=A0A850HDI2_9SPHN|nr:zinc-dependent alcohol dehydrogenase family protein [Altererythrobacter lutimaris]NVE95690.1 alcohol dehydrogenase catalytic domain-containing protein [Altererythrobacter lutimaris]
MHVKAAILKEAGLAAPYAQSMPLSVETVKLGGPGANEILVEVKAAGLCHSDLSVIDNNRPRPLPMALGHEAAGIVREIGSNVSGLVSGDHVALVFVPSCGSCLPCATGRQALCEPGAAANAQGTLLSGERRIEAGGSLVNHHLGVSAFAEHIVVDHRSAVKIDPELPLEVAALFGCAVLTGVGAVFNTAQVEPGSTVAVIGLGGVGMSSVLGARAAGARQIIAVDIQPEKLELASSLGASATFDAKDPDCADQIRAFTQGGVDYAIDMTGVASALELAWKITIRGGTTVTGGLPHPDARMSIPPVVLVGEERTLKGSYLGGAVPTRDVPRYIAMHQAGLLPVEKLMGEAMPLEEINRGFDALASGSALRQLIVF